MKTMTCRQLGGACDLAFRADSFEELAALSQNHGKEMFQKGDEAHLQAMAEMKTPATPGASATKSPLLKRSARYPYTGCSRALETVRTPPAMPAWVSVSPSWR